MTSEPDLTLRSLPVAFQYPIFVALLFCEPCGYFLPRAQKKNHSLSDLTIDLSANLQETLTKNSRRAKKSREITQEGYEKWGRRTRQIPGLEVVNIEFRDNLDGPLQAIHLPFQVIRNKLDVRWREFETRKRRRNRH